MGLPAYLRGDDLHPVAIPELEPGQLVLVPSYGAGKPLEVAVTFDGPGGAALHFLALSAMYGDRVAAGSYLFVGDLRGTVFRMATAGPLSFSFDASSPSAKESESDSSGAAVMTAAGFRIMAKAGNPTGMDRYTNWPIDPSTWQVDGQGQPTAPNFSTFAWKITGELSDRRVVEFSRQDDDYGLLVRSLRR